jgi:Cu+-exporting ATPase
MCLQPDTAVLASSLAVVALDAVAVGEVLVVAPGERVPLDGKLLAGEVLLDESMLTGEGGGGGGGGTRRRGRYTA